MKAKDTIAVNEIFGLTFQGEGKNVGKPTYFLRVAGCNQFCVWCDSAYTWRYSNTHPHRDDIIYDRDKEVHPMEVMEIYEKLLQMDTHLIRSLVISGGEPMLQQRALSPLINILKNNRWYIEMETAGSITPDFDNLEGINDVTLFNVSIKLSHSGNPRELSINPVAIRALATHRVAWKFVIGNQDDMQEVDALVAQFNLKPSNVYIMPEGVTLEAIAEMMSENIVQQILRRGYNLTTRLQITMYGNVRGV